MPLYRLILKRAWKISWKNKWLWFLGFFAAFLSNETVYESIMSNFNTGFSGRDFVFITKDFLGVGLLDIFKWSFLKDWWTGGGLTFSFMLLLTVAFACLLLFFLFMSIISQAGLVKSAITIDLGKKISLKQAFQSGIEKFWTVLCLNILTKVIFFGAFVFIGYLFSLLIKVNPIGVIDYFLYFLFAAILIFGALIIYYLTIYGTAFIVLRGKKLFSSIGLAWHIFIRNIVINLEMALILFAIVVIVTIAYLITVFILGVPLVLVYMLLSFALAQKGALIAAGLAVVMLLIVTVLFGAWYSTFQLSCWSLLFEELALKRAKSKISRIVESVRSSLGRAPSRTVKRSHRRKK
ncbi:MAG: hypothetical protein ACOZBH_01000 [Patescibacteria group bacterium]